MTTLRMVSFPRSAAVTIARGSMAPLAPEEGGREQPDRERDAGGRVELHAAEHRAQNRREAREREDEKDNRRPSVGPRVRRRGGRRPRIGPVRSERRHPSIVALHRGAPRRKRDAKGDQEAAKTRPALAKEDANALRTALAARLKIR
jgi:hypothetical protein